MNVKKKISALKLSYFKLGLYGLMCYTAMVYMSDRLKNNFLKAFNKEDNGDGRG